MTSLPRDREDETVGKAEGGLVAEVVERSGHDVDRVVEARAESLRAKLMSVAAAQMTTFGLPFLVQRVF